MKGSRLDWPYTVLVFDSFCKCEMLLKLLSVSIKQLSSPSDVSVEAIPHSLSSLKLPGFVLIVFTIAITSWVALKRNRAPYIIALILCFSISMASFVQCASNETEL